METGRFQERSLLLPPWQYPLPAGTTLLESVTVDQFCLFLNFVSGGLVWNVLFLDLTSFVLCSI